MNNNLEARTDAICDALIFLVNKERKIEIIKGEQIGEQIGESEGENSNYEGHKGENEYIDTLIARLSTKHVVPANIPKIELPNMNNLKTCAKCTLQADIKNMKMCMGCNKHNCGGCTAYFKSFYCCGVSKCYDCGLLARKCYVCHNPTCKQCQFKNSFGHIICRKCAN
jgi:hypothetical protein